jgi:hypothetical protein
MDQELKEQLLQHVNHVDDLASELYRQIEEDESISDEKWIKYDGEICRILNALNHLKEDIHFT